MKSTGLLHRPPTSVRPQGVWSLFFLDDAPLGAPTPPRCPHPPQAPLLSSWETAVGKSGHAPRRSGPEATQSRLSFVASSTLIPFLAFISADASSDEWDPPPPSSSPIGLRPLQSSHSVPDCSGYTAAPGRLPLPATRGIPLLSPPLLPD
jgi:hypothetical protein